MIFTFYKARGMAVGSSLVEEDKLDLAKKLEEAAKAKGVEFILPTDVVIADKFDENANTKVVSADAIPEGWMVSCASRRVDNFWMCNIEPGLQQLHVPSCPDASKNASNLWSVSSNIKPPCRVQQDLEVING